MANMEPGAVENKMPVGPDHTQPRDWVARAPLSQAQEQRLNELQREMGLSRIALRLLIQRGNEDRSSIEEYLSPRLEKLTDPFAVADLRKACERLALARENGEKVRIFGDYDVDGTTGSALLHWVFREFGFTDVDVRQPDRFKDGYGLNIGAVEEAAQDGVQVLVTVDCGITSFAPAEKAKELGLDLIIVDHHQLDPEKGMPQALAVVNPQRSDCGSGLKMLCGCGLAFYLGRGLRS
jgi:single-stranded-DNA-specific exonuclease